ncbi:MAG TPA: hypothetical protein DDX89_06270 [Candidatus Omnitrophica bacterium]|nr:MAG: hypothetical protein A2Z92_04045 [Omnitrophica WOR_2 bacterium GWA2_63_20]OGX18732.1 MAG: hypothetical protein A2105_03030 [Omnitrophica WOR_2 bacterium GWF2_63_9]OGX30876.1 MAG: hypothetical protein A3E56_00270 [Omnitrophica WOR_2 bacterium RIFCSPHIGHO2_12_FULL_64_13]OGX36777.1 MAG: hypothetical protein A3B73_00700 [Omnitrophica WOR_2 bacterium RIFCSPHIGHO2_02_FULL_63_39]OGX46280.1 MAG: hypothetical protein A3I71_07700 [Omnitrophica WOR_2 bacterium RIFCSPLOWO2_02_FULL_63_16]OGX47058.1
MERPKRSRTKDLLDFEIAFYERLLCEDPDFIDALRAVGEAYTRRGWHEKAFAVDQRLTRLRPEDSFAWYNAACSLALLNRLDEAFETLAHALALGYDDFEYLLKDPDLSVLRRSPKLRQLLEQRLASQ